MKESFQRRLWRAVKELGDHCGEGWVPREELRQHLDLAGPGERKKLSTAICELVEQGRLERKGSQAVRALEPEAGAPQKQEVMWRILRAKRLVTSDNLAALAQVNRSYAQQWLQGLIRMGLVENIGPSRYQGGHYRLLRDPGPQLPRDEHKAGRLKAWKQKRREALAKLDAAFAAVAEARLAVSDLEED
jgi:predicted transcriptional regulator